jgi:hypothetical protein
VVATAEGAVLHSSQSLLSLSFPQYFWLLILRDAIIDLEKMILKEGSAEKALEKVEQRVAVERKAMPPAPLTPSKFSDAMRCMTTYEPRADPDAQLMDYVVPADNSKWEVLIGCVCRQRRHVFLAPQRFIRFSFPCSLVR